MNGTDASCDARAARCTGLAVCFVVACGSAGGGAPDSSSSAPPPQFGGGLEATPRPASAALGTLAGESGFFDEESPARPSAEPGGVLELLGVLRDFQASHPDFGDAVADDRGLVESALGSDRKPVYAAAGPTATTTGAANFDQWYRDTPGVNQTLEFTLRFTPGAEGISTYDNPEFFPLDGQLYGNEYQEHNFHFTFELHTEFAYRGGEVFTFAGDDDLWVFINGRLAIDLGGVHSTQTETIDLDAEADALGLVIGETYALDFFHAERHATGSHFRVDTSLRFTSPGTIILR